MITLEAADLIEGDASAANVVDYTINGVQIDSSRNVDVKALADGQLAGSKATLYTTPASTTAIVKSITLVNTDVSARTVNLYIQRDGTNSRRIIPEDLSLEANGGSVVVSDAVYVYSASGELLYTVTAHASKHITGGSDEVDGDKLDIDWNPTNYTPTTTPSEADNVDNLTAHLYGIDQELGQKLENVVEDTTPQLGGDLDCQNNRFTDMLGFLMKAATELTISSGIVTVTQMFHTVDTEGDAATDDLDTINGGSTVNMIVIRAANDARTVVVKHNSGNIWLQGKADINMDDLEDGLLLVWDGTKWFDIAAGGGGGGGSSTWLGLTDTPASFSGQAGKIARVNAAPNALEFAWSPKPDSVFWAFLNDYQNNLEDNVWTRVDLNAEVFDPGGNFDVANYRYVVPYAGYYSFTGNIGFINLIANKRYMVAVYNGGAKRVWVAYHASYTGACYGNATTTFHCNAGDYIYLYGNPDCGASTVDVFGHADYPEITFLQGYLVQAD